MAVTRPEGDTQRGPFLVTGLSTFYWSRCLTNRFEQTVLFSKNASTPGNVYALVAGFGFPYCLFFV
jgi:hypothetical protein